MTSASIFRQEDRKRPARDLSGRGPPPANLGPAGTRLWQAVLADDEMILDAGGLALLEQIVFSYERAERLQAAARRRGGRFIRTSNC